MTLPPVRVMISRMRRRMVITRSPTSWPTVAMTPRMLRWAAGASGPTTKSGPPRK